MKAIFKRELKSYFSSPIGYVCVAVLLALYGLYYFMVMSSLVSSMVPMVYSATFMWTMMIIPILTMRSMSDDTRNKTDQALLTAPVGVTSIVLGKFLACFAVFAIAVAGSLLPALVISFVSKMSWAMVLGTVAGTLLYGAAMIAIGVFISSLTVSQIIAAIGTFGVAIFLTMVDNLGGANQIMTKIASWISFNSRYQPFTSGIFNVSSIMFFLSVIAVFVFLTARKLESRRWS